jgi:hypothetical protein
MRHLVPERRVVALGVTEGLDGRHLHVVGSGAVESEVAAVANFRSGRRKEQFRVRNAVRSIAALRGRGSRGASQAPRRGDAYPDGFLLRKEERIFLEAGTRMTSLSR